MNKYIKEIIAGVLIAVLTATTTGAFTKISFLEKEVVILKEKQLYYKRRFGSIKKI